MEADVRCRRQKEKVESFAAPLRRELLRAGRRQGRLPGFPVKPCNSRGVARPLESEWGATSERGTPCSGWLIRFRSLNRVRRGPRRDLRQRRWQSRALMACSGPSRRRLRPGVVAGARPKSTPSCLRRFLMSFRWAGRVAGPLGWRQRCIHARLPLRRAGNRGTQLAAVGRLRRRTRELWWRYGADEV